MTWVRLAQPTLLERLFVLLVQGLFSVFYFVIYILHPRLAHRIVGYLEEEAVISYTQFLNEIDAGRIANVPAPQIAKDYWKLADDAKLRDVVLAVRADEAQHRDVNHELADRIKEKRENLRDQSFHPPDRR